MRGAYNAFSICYVRENRHKSGRTLWA